MPGAACISGGHVYVHGIIHIRPGVEVRPRNANEEDLGAVLAPRLSIVGDMALDATGRVA